VKVGQLNPLDHSLGSLTNSTETALIFLWMFPSFAYGTRYSQLKLKLKLKMGQLNTGNAINSAPLGAHSIRKLGIIVPQLD
jgi:hypothetical protein